MKLTLVELERKIQELRPQLYDNSPVVMRGTGAITGVEVGVMGEGANGRKSLTLVGDTSKWLKQ